MRGTRRGAVPRVLLVLALVASTVALSLSASSRTRHRPVTMAAAQPVGSLLSTCKVACDDVTLLVEAVYARLAKEPGGAVRKEDKSFFSLADGIVQVRRGPRVTPSISRSAPPRGRATDPSPWRRRPASLGLEMPHAHTHTRTHAHNAGGRNKSRRTMLTL